jgi:hypothetical protein
MTNVVPFRQPAPPLPPITSLPFVVDYLVYGKGRKRKGATFRCFWSVSPTGDFSADTRQGNRFALRFLRWARTQKIQAGSILGWITGDMPVKHTGLEIGFFSIIGAAAIAGGDFGDEDEFIAERDRRLAAAMNAIYGEEAKP